MPVMFPIFVAALIALATIAEPCGAWEVANLVVIEHGELVIDHSKTVSEITQAQAKGGFPSRHGLGLFQNRLKTELAFNRPETFPTTKRLSMTTRIKTSPVIYVAREFPKDSCSYGVILGHERQHLLFDQEVLREMPNEIRSITQTVFPVDELDRGGSLNQDMFRKRFFQQYKYAYDAISFARHHSIDNPDSYQRLGAQCNGEIARRLAGMKP